MIYGYIRVSTDKQDCNNQKLGIESKAVALGIKIDKYIEDSGLLVPVLLQVFEWVLHMPKVLVWD